MEKHPDLLAKLTHHLDNDPAAKRWAKKEVENFAELETARKTLCTALYAAVDANVVFDDVDALVDTVEACLIFDRANACLNMKLVRDDPECPSGFLWINKADLAALGTEVKWGTTVQTNSVNKRYAMLLEGTRYADGNVPEGIEVTVREGTAPYAPAWMVEKFGLTLPVFRA